MARPREFDIDEVLDDALETSWRRGYAAASMADLMGLEKSSINVVWKGKQDLFEKALARHQNRDFLLFSSTQEQTPSAIEGLRRCLSTVGDMRYGQGSEKRCFAVNTAVEPGAIGESGRPLISDDRKRAEKLLAGAVRQAQDERGLSGDIRPDLAAKCLIAFTGGLHISGKAGLTKEDSRDLVEPALSGLHWIFL